MSWLLGNSQKGLAVKAKLDKMAAEREQAKSLGKFEEGDGGSVFTYVNEYGQTVTTQAEWDSAGVPSGNWWDKE